MSIFLGRHQATRFYTINNLNWLTSDNTSVSINSGISRQKKEFNFGNIDNETFLRDYYISIDAKKYIDNLILQFGLNYDLQMNHTKGTAPKYYYAVSPESPSVFNELENELGLLEQYTFADYNLNEKIRLGGGIRLVKATSNDDIDMSTQLTLRYRPKNHSTLVFGIGRYHNYRRPSVLNPNFTALRSDQVSLDYEYNNGYDMIKAAVYHKKEIDEGNFFGADHTMTNGLEFLWQRKFGRRWKVSVSNLFVDQKLHFENETFNGDFDFDFFIKSFVQYNSPKISASLVYQARPGHLYTGIDGGAFNSEVGFYEPFFQDNILGQRYANYYRWDLSLSKYLPWNGKTLIAYLNINNLLNADNERVVSYSADYSSQQIDMYSFRTVFVGFKLSFDH